ncbi:hypothetical protein H3U87_01375 [Bifidobacterium sp. W8101]|uniref:hypothetical protein n=1 Tax=Bifidobacterium TaxID=1678 RepID=UPI0018DD6228|nr:MULTISPECIES: hypothetical protein [Bifidobacterium]MBI0125800.1 hypothetical protein [Bifidobacterium choladohabitans]MBI0127369.1 hypothetical protein [Bifidobacterium sp. W8103]MBI0137957.1 hypothetical protein [Bifidobacterium sp. W8105]MBI0149072.1 hypothetical protein [Bifidobacterium sp. W8107]
MPASQIPVIGDAEMRLFKFQINSRVQSQFAPRRTDGGTERSHSRQLTLFSYVNMKALKALTDSLPQTSMVDNALTLSAKPSYINKDRRSEQEDIDCMRKVNSSILAFPLSKAYTYV